MGIFSKKHTCYDCEEQFKKRDELLVHGQTVHNLTLINCQICNKSLLYNKSRIEHTEEHKVSVGLQIANLLLGSIIIFAWIYAFYKIQKLRYGLLITVGSTVFIFSLLFIPTFEGQGSIVMLFFILFYFLCAIPAIFYFVIKWSREWNKKIDAIVESISKEERQS